MTPAFPQEGTVAINGVDLYYRDWGGEGRTLLLLHGLGGVAIDVTHGHAGPLSGQDLGDGPAYTASATGNQGYPAIKVYHHGQISLELGWNHWER